MSAASMSVDGSRLIRIGLSLLRRAFRDALRGAGLVFSGIGGVLGAAIWEAWTSTRALPGRIPGLARIAALASGLIADAVRRLSIAFARSYQIGAGFVAAALKIALWGLAGAALGAVLTWLLPQFVPLALNLDWKAAAAQFLESVPVILGVLSAVGAAVLAMLVLNWLIGWIGRLFAPVRVDRLIVGAAIVSALALLASGVIVILQGAREISPPPVAAFANVALFAGAAVLAVLVLSWPFGWFGRLFTPVRVRRLIVGFGIVSALALLASVVIVILQAAREVSLPPVAAFANVALFAGAAVLAVFLLGWLLKRMGRPLARVRVRWIAAGAAIVWACALFAALVMLNLQEAPKFSPPPIAVLANVAVFAGAALFAVFAVFALFPGFAVISFGRAGVAAVSIGGLRKTDADSASDTLCETHEQVEGETARPLQEEEPTIAASPEARPQRSEPMSGAPRSRSLYRLTAMGLALAIVAAVAALWSRPLAEDVKRRAAAAPSVSEGTQAPRKTPSVRFPAQPAAPGLFAVVPVADDRPGELVWRSGYRALTERIDDGANVSRLALPRRACSAEALLAFGSASSDGAPDANARLARRRALWAAEWARRELASCPPGTTAPEILAISLGQAEGSPDARDRRVRLLAIERGTGLLFSDRAALRRSSAATFPDIQRFSAFELCVAPSSTASHLNMAPCR